MCWIILIFALISPIFLSAGLAAQKGAVKQLIIGPLSDCESAGDFEAFVLCDIANEKAMVDAQVIEGKGMAGWIPHPDPSLQGWFIDPKVLGRYAFKIKKMKDIALLSTILEKISPELSDLRASIFYKAHGRLVAELLPGKIEQPPPKLRDDIVRRSRELMGVPHPPKRAPSITAKFCLSTHDDKCAEEFAARAQKLAPGDADSFALRAAALVGLSRPQEALADAESALLLKRGHRLAVAIKDYAQAAMREPNTPKPFLLAFYGATPPPVAVPKPVEEPVAEPVEEPVAEPVEEPVEESVEPPAVVAVSTAASPEFPPAVPVEIPAETAVVTPKEPRREAGASSIGRLIPWALGAVVLAVAVFGGVKLTRSGLVSLKKRKPRRKPSSGRHSPAASLDGDEPLLGGRYRLGARIGKTDTGLLYRGVDIERDNWVTIRKVREEIARSPELRREFLKEVHSASRLYDFSIAAIRTVLEEGDDLYLVYERVGGESLDRLLENKAPLDRRSSLAILQSTAMALGAAHANGIFHRDLRPANIIVSDDKGVKVMDFGVAHCVRRGVWEATRQDALLDSPYRAPEQEAGKAAGKESDIFALGVLAYQMLFGSLPFPGPDYSAQKKKGAFARPGGQGAGASAGLDPLFEKVLHADPSRRHRSAYEFYTKLESAVKN